MNFYKKEEKKKGASITAIAGLDGSCVELLYQAKSLYADWVGWLMISR